MSITLHSPCTCGGNNENCFKCGGWGFINDENNSKYRDVDYTGKTGFSSIKKRRVKKSLRTSSKCDVLIKHPPKNLSKVYNTPLSSSPASSLAQCPRCHAKVRTDRLKRHLEKIHKTSIQSDKQYLSQQDSNTVTKISTYMYSSTHNSNRSINLMLEQNPTQAHSSIRSYERSLDATKDYSTAYRERGRFGSHCSYDDYDDESRP